MFELNDAIEKGDLEKVKYLVEVEGHSVNMNDDPLAPLFESPITTAARCNKLEIADYLIKKGANINGEEGDMSPIEIAYAFNNIEIAILLFTKGATLPDYLNINYFMDFAIASNNPSAVEALLTYTKADIDCPDSDFFDQTLLHKTTSSEAQPLEVISKLIEMGANVNLADAFNVTPLLYSIGMGNEKIVALLLDSGAQIDLVGGHRNVTPLMAAAFCNSEKHQKIVELLIKNGADVNKVDDDGYSALDHAAKQGNLDAVSKLIEAGADLTHKTNDGYTAADIALANGHIEIVNKLALHGLESTKPNIEDNNVDLIEPIKIHEVLTLNTDKGSFASDVIDHNNHSFSNINHAQLEHEQVYTYVSEVNATLNQTIEQPELSFG